MSTLSQCRANEVNQAKTHSQLKMGVGVGARFCKKCVKVNSKVDFIHAIFQIGVHKRIFVALLCFIESIFIAVAAVSCRLIFVFVHSFSVFGLRQHNQTIKEEQSRKKNCLNLHRIIIRMQRKKINQLK